MRSEARFLPKDFVETREGLFFAVVAAYPEDGEVLATLRYAPGRKGLHKLETAAAVSYLQDRHPQYLRHSIHVDTVLPIVPWSAVARHFRPEERVRSLLQRGSLDPIERKAHWLLGEFASAGVDLCRVGLTGSLLIGAHTLESDLDFVAYEEGTFQALRRWVQTAVGQGRLDRPDPAGWKGAYERRGCALDFAEYLWHERRKFNQGWVQGTKFDLTLVVPGASPPNRWARKLGMVTLRAKVTDASRAFEFPARYRIDHPRIQEVLSFTHTYAGQAFAGETIEACGRLEVWEDERERLIVGSSREAAGEFIKVCPMPETRRKEPESEERVGASAILLPEPEGVILDMDGLALDTEATYCQAWQQAAAALGCPLPEEFCRSLFGHHADEVRRLLAEFTGNRLDLEEFARLASRIWHDHVAVQGVARMPGLEALLSFLRARSIPYALATNSEARFADICLERAGARRLFPVIVTRDQVAHGKPDPDLYLEAARRLGVPPQCCLALEDSEAGLEAAHRSGAFTVLVSPRQNLSKKVREYARARFSSLGELLATLKLGCSRN